MRAKTIVAKIEQMLAEIAKIDVERIIQESDQVAAVKRRNSGAKFTLRIDVLINVFFQSIISYFHTLLNIGVII